MNLEKFIEKSLIDITNGLKKANQTLKHEGNNFGPFSIGNESHDKKKTTPIRFDIAVTANDSKNDTGGVGISVVGINAGGKTESKSGQESISRISFEIHANYEIK